MIWSEFKASVRTYLPVESDRLNVGEGGATSLFDLFLRQGGSELQSLVPSLRVNHETIFRPADVTIDEEASVGNLPEGARPKEAYYYKTDERCYRTPLNLYSWDNRFDLICGSVNVATISVDPHLKTFYLYPKLETDYALSIIWDGTKLDFTDGETVPFDEQSVQAVADYVGA